jgi:ribonuclease P protein component
MLWKTSSRSCRLYVLKTRESVLVHSMRPCVKGPRTRCAWSNSLTEKAVFGVIAGFPHIGCALRFGMTMPASSLAWQTPAGALRIATLAGVGRGDHGNQDETHLSSLQSSPRPYSWLSRPHEDPRRQGRDQRTARQGSQASGRLSGDGPSPATPVLGRIVRSADFERVLGQPPCARGRHFAIHFVDARPSLVSSAAGRRQIAKEAICQELSTVDEPACTQPVDDSVSTIPSNGISNRPHFWFGAIVPKRHARRAVTRSLIKRQILAALLRREMPGELTLRSGLWVVRLRAPFECAAYPSAASGALRRATAGELDALLGEAQRKLAIAQPATCGAR